MDVWSHDRSARRAWDRVTFDSYDDIYPGLVDRRGEVSSSQLESKERAWLDLYRKSHRRAFGGSEQLLLATPETESLRWIGRPTVVFCCMTALHPKRGRRTGALPLLSEGASHKAVRGRAESEYNERPWGSSRPTENGSPTSRTRPDCFEIYVRPFPGPGGDALRIHWRWQTGRGWNPNGQELFYIGADDRLMAAPVTSSAGREDGRIRHADRAVCDESAAAKAPNTPQAPIRGVSGRELLRDAHRRRRRQRARRSPSF